jgi:tetraacyldisaccharide 4'-kinase
LPSGGYKETKMMYSFVPLVLKDGTDFIRTITFKQDNKIIEILPKNCVIVTGISKPNRLLEYLPKDINIEFFIDHHNFTQNDIDSLLKKYPKYSFVVTAKDLVKIEKFNLNNIILMDLEVTIIKEFEYDFTRP